jgi:hypothetical protein
MSFPVCRISVMMGTYDCGIGPVPTPDGHLPERIRACLEPIPKRRGLSIELITARFLAEGMISFRLTTWRDRTHRDRNTAVLPDPLQC